jgi:hypothetical protein
MCAALYTNAVLVKEVTRAWMPVEHFMAEGAAWFLSVFHLAARQLRAGVGANYLISFSALF